MGRSGAYYYGEYANEASFKAGGTPTRILGFNHRYSDVTPAQNMGTLPGHNDQKVVKFYYGMFAGAFAAEWTVSNPWFFDGLVGAFVTTGSNPYTHTADLAKAKKTHVHEIGFAGESANVVRTLLGSVWQNVTLSSSINQTLTARGSGLYSREDAPTTTLDSSIPVDDLDFPYTFEHGTIELPVGTVLAEVQSVEATINPNPIPVPGHGDKFNASVTWGEFTVTGRLNLTLKDAVHINQVLARAEVATLKLKYSNGLSGVNEKTIQLNYTGLGFPEHGVSYAPNELITQNLPWQARNLQVVATNAISAVP